MLLLNILVFVLMLMAVDFQMLAKAVLAFAILLSTSDVESLSTLILLTR